MKRTIAIIPARGGSKRIPRKNIRNFLGQPIIKYSIEAALASDLFDEVMISTDDREIANIAIKYGAVFPFFRSEKNSEDLSHIPDVIEEVLLEYKKRSIEYDYACCLYPTAPFITISNLKKAWKVIHNSGADSVLAITRFSYPIQRSLKTHEDGRLSMIWPKTIKIRSQDLTPAYHDTGQFFYLNVKAFLDKKKIYTDHTRYILIPESEMHDIDNEEDWKMAELKYKLLKKTKYEKNK